jgi:hypothetical protein
MDSAELFYVSEVDVERPRRGLVAMLSMASISVWSFTLLVSAQSLLGVGFN